MYWNLDRITSNLSGKAKKKKFNCIILQWSNIHVVVNFLTQVIFVSLLFLGMLMYANEVETKEK